MGRARAILLDRDGTVVHARHYPSRPEELQLYDGVAAELCRLQVAGFRLAIITNQGGLAHGYFSQSDLDALHIYLTQELQALGVSLDGIYHCPHHPEGIVPGLARTCSCRKPQPGMLLQAASDLDLDLRRSWFVGDILDDIEAGHRAGCRTVLVDLGTEALPPTALRTPHFVARNTVHALQLIAAVEQLADPVELQYMPERWQHGPLAELGHGV